MSGERKKTYTQHTYIYALKNDNIKRNSEQKIDISCAHAINNNNKSRELNREKKNERLKTIKKMLMFAKCCWAYNVLRSLWPCIAYHYSYPKTEWETFNHKILIAGDSPRIQNTHKIHMSCNRSQRVRGKMKKNCTRIMKKNQKWTWTMAFFHSLACLLFLSSSTL